MRGIEPRGVCNEPAQADRGLTIMLDDDHDLPASREVGEGLALLLDHLPPQVRVIVYREL